MILCAGNAGHVYVWGFRLPTGAAFGARAIHVNMNSAYKIGIATSTRHPADLVSYRRMRGSCKNTAIPNPDPILLYTCYVATRDAGSAYAVETAAHHRMRTHHVNPPAVQPFLPLMRSGHTELFWQQVPAVGILAPATVVTEIQKAAADCKTKCAPKCASGRFAGMASTNGLAACYNP